MPKLKVLELGTGCGIVGRTLAKCRPEAEIIVTDLPSAEEIAEYNISLDSTDSKLDIEDENEAGISYMNLDWETPYPQDLASKEFNLVLVADCTYNPDVVPYLVKTLASVSDSSKNVLILVAMKVRHESEQIFFTLMEEAQLRAVDKLALPLPHIGEEAEEIEIHLFKGF